MNEELSTFYINYDNKRMDCWIQVYANMVARLNDHESAVDWADRALGEFEQKFPDGSKYK